MEIKAFRKNALFELIIVYDLHAVVVGQGKYLCDHLTLPFMLTHVDLEQIAKTSATLERGAETDRGKA